MVLRRVMPVCSIDLSLGSFELPLVRIAMYWHSHTAASWFFECLVFIFILHLVMAYAHHRRALVPESWCSSNELSDIQQFYESNFYRCPIPAAPESVVVFDVQVVRVTSRNGRILR